MCKFLIFIQIFEQIMSNFESALKISESYQLAVLLNIMKFHVSPGYKLSKPANISTLQFSSFWNCLKTAKAGVIKCCD